MRGLLLKDFYVTWRVYKFLLLIPIMYSVLTRFGVQNTGMVAYIGLFVSMVPMSIYALEERDKWSAYVLSLPYKRTAVVSSKYVFTLILSALFTVLIAAVSAVMYVLGGDVDVKFLIMSMSLVASSSLLPMALSMPFMCAFGAEKGRIAWVVVTVFVSVSVMASLPWGIIFVEDGIEHVVDLSSPVFACAIFAAGLAIFALSWIISVIVYNKKAL